ncbi:hypothetical protein H8959_008373 [Pygathrix nigripes]
MPRGRKSRRRRNARAAEENRNNRKIQASEASETPMAASVVASTPEDDLSGPEEDPSTPEEASTTPEEASSTAQAQKPSVPRSNFQGTKKSLLMSILALIFIMGNSAKEALVWKVLGKLGMQPGRQHSIFGDPKKIVTEEFVRRGYLIYKPVPRSSPVEYEFFWGPRAHVESSKLKVMHFVARVRNRCSKDWPCNYDWDSDDDAEVEAILNSGLTSKLPGSAGWSLAALQVDPGPAKSEAHTAVLQGKIPSPGELGLCPTLGKSSVFKLGHIAGKVEFRPSGGNDFGVVVEVDKGDSYEDVLRPVHRFLQGSRAMEQLNVKEQMEFL